MTLTDRRGEKIVVHCEIDEDAALTREIARLANKLRRSETKQKVASSAGGVVRVWLGRAE